MNITYQDAQQEPVFRQLYLDHFLEEHPCEAVAELVYVEHPLDVLGGIFRNYPKGVFSYVVMQDLVADIFGTKSVSTMSPKELFGRRLRQPIFLKPRLFNTDEELFTVTLRDHEYIHAKDCFYGINIDGNTIITHANAHLLRSEVVGWILESRAYKATEANFPKTSVDKPIIDEYIAHFRDRLTQVSPQNDFEKRVIASVLGPQ